MPLIILLYISKRFLKYIVVVYFILAGIILLLDTAELMRITSQIPEMSFKHIILMSMMKNYNHFNKIWPFIILSAVMLTYRRLSSESALSILKSSGFSVLQLLIPVITLSIIIGVIHLTILNSIGSYCLEQYKNLEALHLKGKKSLINLSSSGLWLKQMNDDELIIIHGLKIIESKKTIYDFTAFYFDHEKSFCKRVDASSAILKDKYWEVHDAQSVDIDYTITKHKILMIPSNITFEQIIDSVSAPNALSFWQLISFIEFSQKSGFPSIKHKLYFWQLLFSPILFAAISIMAYVFSSNISRFNRSNFYTIIAFIIEFIIYFLSDFMNAFALSGNIPIIIASAFPVIASFIIGTYLLLDREFSN